MSPRLTSRRVYTALLSGSMIAVAWKTLACGGLLGVDFDDAHPAGDASAAGNGFPGDVGVTGNCMQDAPCGDAGCPVSTGSIVSLRGSENRICALYRDHSVKCIGLLSEPVQNVAGSDLGIVKLVGGTYLFGIDAQGAVRIIGGSEDAGTSSVQLDFPVTDLAFAGGASCMLTTSCAVKCMGSNAQGTLGNNSTLDSVHPVDVLGLDGGVTKIVGGYGDVCALLADRTVRCWGSNWAGQRGKPASTKSSSVPEDLLIADVANITTGDYFTCALTMSGAIWCFGEGSGSIGTTVQVGTMSAVGTVVRMAMGPTHGCLVTASGGAKCWGENDYGEVGDGTKDKPFEPKDVVGLTSGVVDIAVTRNTSCALTTAGAVKCWGVVINGDHDAGAATPQDVPGL